MVIIKKRRSEDLVVWDAGMLYEKGKEVCQTALNK